MGRCRQNIESNVAGTKITPGSNEDLMRKKVLDVTLQPLNQIAVIPDT
jgi:hypothetical protein